MTMKKSISKNVFFSVITKNLNREILNKNLVTFKRWDGINDEKFLYYGSLLKKKNFFQGGGHEKPIYSEQLPKMGRLGQFAN